MMIRSESWDVIDFNHHGNVDLKKVVALVWLLCLVEGSIAVLNLSSAQVCLSEFSRWNHMVNRVWHGFRMSLSNPCLVTGTVLSVRAPSRLTGLVPGTHSETSTDLGVMGMLIIGCFKWELPVSHASHQMKFALLIALCPQICFCQGAQLDPRRKNRTRLRMRRIYDTLNLIVSWSQRQAEEL